SSRVFPESGTALRARPARVPGACCAVRDAMLWFAALALAVFVGAAPSPHELYLQAVDYYNGQNRVQADRVKAGELFLEAANAGAADAQYTVGRMYQNGLAGVQKDLAQARFWYERSATQGQLEATRNLASLWEGGLGGPQDFKKALDYF